MKAFLLFASLLMATVTASADVSFKVTGSVIEKSGVVAGSFITLYELQTDDGQTIRLSQKDGKALVENCPNGTYELVASSPLPGARMMVIGTENCSN